MDLKKLKLLRKSKGWSQEDIAKEIGIARTYYNSIERGKIDAGFKTIVKIAKALRVKLADLVKD